MILDVAESLFAENGYKAVSLRSILRECGANTAAAHYHFGSKQELLEAIFERRCALMNATRLELLAAAQSKPNLPHLIERILDAFLRPALVWRDDDTGTRQFMRLRAVVAYEQETLARDLIARHFNETSQRFIDALAAQLPHLGRQELYFRFHFLLGAHYYTVLNPGRIRDLSEGECDPADSEQALRTMIAFFAAGLRAPNSLPGSAARTHSMETTT
ncbi:MAG: TetR/AcrR family transcriptional regulator [Pseudolabrys sp.]